MTTKSTISQRLKTWVTTIRLSTLLRMMRLLGKRFWPYAISLVVFSLVVSVCFNIVLAFLMKNVLDAAMDNNQDLLMRALTLALVTFLGGTPIVLATHYICSICIKRTITDLRYQLFHQIANLPLSEFEGGHSGDLVSRVTNDLAQITSIYFDQLQGLTMALIMGVTGMVSIFNIDIRIGVVVLVLGIATVISNARFSKPLRITSEHVQANTGTMTERLVDLLQSIPVVKMFQLQRTIHSTYTNANADLVSAEIDSGNIRAQSDTVNQLFQWLSNLGLLGLGMFFYARGEISFGNAWAIVTLRRYSAMLFLYVGGMIVQIQGSLAAATRVFEVLDRETESESYALETSESIPVDELNASHTIPLLQFNAVTFQYLPSADEEEDTVVLALEDVDLTIGEGKTAALVGPSGSGKSTLIKLLLRLYPEQVGEIRIAGQPARQIKLDTLRDMMAYVPQEAYLFDGTIEENIQMGRPDATLEKLYDAAKSANAHDFILEQPEGYQTRVGERGARLSGGQRQRIAIARALLKNAPILLLDEATSALDSESEQAVQDALETLMHGRTTLAIAHRLSTIEHADTIYVMDAGHIVEYGSHTELLAKNGLYTQLHDLQFAASGQGFQRNSFRNYEFESSLTSS